MFSTKLFFPKNIFRRLACTKKYQWRKIESDFRFRPIWPESCMSESGRTSQILASVAGFRQSNTKIRGSSAIESKSIKRFTIFKIVIRFPKIKEAFMVKLKMIFVDHYFCPHQTPKNAEKHFTENILLRNKWSITSLQVGKM
jgi:hypothetical protein